MPGIVMVGTSPTFFKVPVTEILSDHIRKGACPPRETVVTYCYPPVPHRRSEGMMPLDNRREILRCYEAFKAIVDRGIPYARVLLAYIFLLLPTCLERHCVVLPKSSRRNARDIVVGPQPKALHST